MMSGMEPLNDRPEYCRNRLRDEGKPYPKSGCEDCAIGGMTGCPYEDPERRTSMSNAGIDYRTIGYSPSAAEKELAADEVYERARAFIDRPEFHSDTTAFMMGRSSLAVPRAPLQRVLFDRIGFSMRAMEEAAREKHSLMVKLAAAERALATAREELGAVLDAWPAEKVVPA